MKPSAEARRSINFVLNMEIRVPYLSLHDFKRDFIN